MPLSTIMSTIPSAATGSRCSSGSKTGGSPTCASRARAAPSRRLTDAAKGKALAEAEQLTKDSILEMLGITLTPIRLKCALLSLDTLKNSIHIYRVYVAKQGDATSDHAHTGERNG